MNMVMENLNRGRKEMGVKLSIIIPVYNAEAYICALLERLVPQLTDETELFLIDDGSKDNSLAICRKYQQSAFVNVIHQENQGVSAARNRGLDCISGEYVTFIDSDDMVAENYVETILKLIRETSVDIFQFNYLYKEGGDYKKVNLVNHTGPAKMEAYVTLAITFQVNAPWSKIFKSNIIKEHNLRYAKDITLGEDCIFLFEYLKYANSVYYCSDHLYVYTMYETGLTRTKMSSILQHYNYAVPAAQFLAQKNQLTFYNALLAEHFLCVFLSLAAHYVHLKYSDADIARILGANPYYPMALNAKCPTFKLRVKRFVLAHKLFKIYALLKRIKQRVSP